MLKKSFFVAAVSGLLMNSVPVQAGLYAAGKIKVRSTSGNLAELVRAIQKPDYNAIGDLAKYGNTAKWAQYVQQNAGIKEQLKGAIEYFKAQYKVMAIENPQSAWNIVKQNLIRLDQKAGQVISTAVPGWQNDLLPSHY